MNPSSRRYLGWSIVGLPVLILLAALVVVIEARAFLKSDRFRVFLGDKVSETIHARGAFQTLEWSGSSFFSEGFVAHGRSGADLQEMNAQQVRANVNLNGLWEKKWQVEGVEIERLSLISAGPDQRTEPSAPDSANAQPAEKSHSQGHFFSSWLPDRVEVERVAVANLQLDGQNLETPFAVDGMRIEAKPDGPAWILNASGGTLATAKIPKLTLGEASLRYADSTIFINHADLTVEGGGTIGVKGEVPQKKSATTHLSAKVERVPATTVLPKDWRARLLGLFSADLQLEASGGDYRITGPVSLADARLETLPILEQVALFTRTQRFRQLSLDNVRADFTIEKNRVTAKNFNAESPGLLRIRGEFVVENGRMEGVFLVGVTPSSLRYIPGSQTKIFTLDQDGYLWTTMKVTGPLEHLTEDLSERLAMAAGQELIDTIQKDPSKIKDKLKDAAQSLLDLLGK